VHAARLGVDASCVARDPAAVKGPRAIVVLAAALGSAAAQQWTFLDGPAYSGRMHAFDLSRSRVVALGDEGTLWEFAGTQLLHRATSGPLPPPRSHGVFVFDPARRRVLMFGGRTGLTALGDTWIWDGAVWTPLLAGPQPPARSFASATFDAVRGRVLMQGGQVPLLGVLDDTWEHDGAAWTRRQPATRPGFNTGPMAFDLVRGKAVLMMSTGLAGAPLETWEWDGNDWSRRATTGPATNTSASLAYDLVRARTVLFGGIGIGNEIWEWDGAAWTRTTVPNAPSRIDAAIHFDVLAGTVQIFGGFDFVAAAAGTMQGSARTDAYAWDGAALVRLHGDLRPPTRYGHILVGDAARGDVVLFGGMRQQAPVAETWTWNGNAWTERQPAASPSARTFAAATFDAGSARVLLFGGFAAGAMLGDLWAWDGATWTLVDTGTGPRPRSSAGLAHDAVRGTTVLFGGSVAPSVSSVRNDTWEWNGTAWTQRTSPAAPSPREGAAMAYDPVRARIVLFGGRDGPTAQDQFADTWEWNGASWTPVQVPLPPPPPLLMPSLTFDAPSGTMMLVGTIIVGQSAVTHVWRYDGGTWTQVGTAANTRLGCPCALDPVRDRIVAAQGAVLAEFATTPASVTAFGAGCGAPVPQLTVRTRPRIGDPGFGFEARSGPGQAVLFGVAFGQAAVPVGHGCTLLLGGATVVRLAAANVLGSAEIVTPLPAVPALRGVALVAQAAVLDAAAAGGFRLSPGLQISVGD
jgi:hypothetical protein